MQDVLVCNGHTSGNLPFKEAYIFKSHISQKLSWAKTLWAPDIPPSRSFLAWRIMHDKLPTNDNLKLRGCSLASICNNCLHDSESTNHILYHCSYATRLWNWLASLLNINMSFNSPGDLWNLWRKFSNS